MPSNFFANMFMLRREHFVDFYKVLLHAEETGSWSKLRSTQQISEEYRKSHWHLGNFTLILWILFDLPAVDLLEEQDVRRDLNNLT